MAAFYLAAAASDFYIPWSNLVCSPEGNAMHSLCSSTCKKYFHPFVPDYLALVQAEHKIQSADIRELFPLELEKVYKMAETSDKVYASNIFHYHLL